MEQNAIRKKMWEEAGKAGLALGSVSTAYLFITSMLGGINMPTFLNMSLTFILWGVKFSACIWLMMRFMKRYAATVPEADNSITFRLGAIAALLSPLVYAAASFANIAFFSADLYAEQMTLFMQQMAPMMDSNTMEQMDDMLVSMPQITFFSNLIYCFFYGTILSFILSRNIPDRNPFADRSSDEW